MERENLLNDLSNFNEVFKKDVACDNIKSNKKAGLYPLSRKHMFGKTTGEGGGQIDTSPLSPQPFMS